MSGMQRELLHLEQLEERSAAVVLSDKDAAVLPVDYRRFCFLFISFLVLDGFDSRSSWKISL